MKTLVKTTTAELNSMNLNFCGDYEGEFQDEAYWLLSEYEDLTTFKGEMWADIMFDMNEKVYAVCASGTLTSDSQAMYIELEQEDCPIAFEAMHSKLYNQNLKP